MSDTTTTNPEQGNGVSTYRSIAEFISNTQLMLNNTKANPATLAKMVAAGYTEAQIDSKLNDLDALRTLNETQAVQYGEQFAATAALQEQMNSFRPIYMDHLALARIAFRQDVSAQKALALHGDRRQSLSGYIDQALQFYNNALASVDFKTSLSHKGITQAVLEGGKSEFESLQARRQTQQKEMGEAQTATVNRDALYDDIAEWEMDFRATAKVVLRESPQLMEELGLKQV